MSIVIIRGPEASAHPQRMPLSQSLHTDVVTSLVDRAVGAGKLLAIRTCGTNQELLAALGDVARDPPEILLVDPGAGMASRQVDEALRKVRVPFIEVHDDSAATLEPELRNAPANRVAVVHGFKAQSYTIAMSMALEHIGCAESESTLHVGT